MLAKVGAHERAYGNDGEALSATGVERGLDQYLAETTPPKSFGDFSVDQSQRIRRTFVSEKRRLTVDRQLEAVGLAVIDDVHARVSIAAVLRLAS